ncbi:MAG TPA: glycosyltransferase family 25 protein [Chitinophagaceae bacterium]|nr:glycosyltransferase family 25 protein [Chitinophagaceae bacterium]
MPDIVSATNDLLHQYFDKVLVMTVARFTERQERVKERLAGIDFEFFFGADKNELDDKKIGQQYLYKPENSLSVWQIFPPLNTGEIACALSHTMIYRAMLDNNWQRILILEDDVVPDDTTLPMLADCLKELPADWELFYLGYLKNEKATVGKKLKIFWYKIMAFIGMSRMPLVQLSHVLPKAFSHSLMRAGFHDCTHAYAISLEGAKKLLQTQTPVQYRADNLLSALVLKGELKAFISRSNLFNQEIFTDLTNKSYVRKDPKLNIE